MGELQVRMLGPLDVLRQGESVPLPPGRARALLGMLLVHAGRVVPTDRLIDDLWRGDPPPSAPHALQVYVSQLRKLLEPDRTRGGTGQILVTRPPGYIFIIPPEQSDAATFELQFARGCRALDEHRPADAARLLADALALWRGPVLADLADEPFVDGEATRLEELRLVATERWAEAELAIGRHRELVSELEGLVRVHPFRERLWGQLIVALYRSGRPTDALHAYHRVRTMLGEELGLEPSPELRRLETAVLRHDPDLLGPPAGGTPVAPTEPSPTRPEASRETALPLPARLQADPALPFVGRIDERATLERARKRAAEEGVQVVLLAGEPGIGKTRLATEVAFDAHRDGDLVLLGTCDEDLAVPYQPFVEALQHLLTVLTDDEVTRSLGERGGELLRILPELTGRRPGLPPPQRADPETERYLLFSAVVDFLGAGAAGRRVVLLLDDLHWATKPTVLLLKHLVRSSKRLPLLIMGIYRDCDIGPAHPLTGLLAEFRREPDVDRITVGGLSNDEAVAMIEAMVGRDLDGGELNLAHAVQAEADGSPFFVRELIHHLVEAGGLLQPAVASISGALPNVGIPDSVREVIGYRMSRLPETTAQLLTLGTVIGQEFDAALLAQVAGIGRPAVIECLDVARRAALVQEVSGSPGRYVFVHALIRHTLYDELGPARRMEMHRLVAEALEALAARDTYVNQLARHWLAALPAMGLQPDDIAKAVRYGEKAGHAAMASLAYEEAISHFEGALQAARQGQDRMRICELLILLGEAQRNAGDAGHNETLLEAANLADKLNDPDRSARAALANQRGVYSRIGGVAQERVVALEAALRAVGPVYSSVRARLLAALATELHFDGDRRLELAREAVSVARRLEDNETLAQTLAAYWFAIWGSGVEADRGAIAAELQTAAEKSSDRSLQFQAGVSVFLTATGVGDIQRADQGLATCLDVAEELGQPLLRWRAISLQVHRAIIAGRLSEAECLLTELLRLGEATGQPDGLAYVATPTITLRLLQGRPHEVEALVTPVIDRFPTVIGYPAFLAWAFAEGGRLDDSQAILDRYRPDGFAGVPRDYIWRFCLCAFSRACARTGDAAAARDLYDLLFPYRTVMTTLQTTWFGPVTHDLGVLAGVLGRYDDADRHFSEAVGVQDRLGACATVVHTRLEWARMLLQTGRPEATARARTLLDEAERAAQQLGLEPLEARVRQLRAG